MISVEGLSIRFRTGLAIAFTDFSVESGCRLGVLGPNGSGKSTLLRILAGLISPTAGNVRGLPPRGRTVLVHQDPYLFRGTVRSNLEWALRVSARGHDATPRLAHLGLRELADRDARNLSGGERRRVAIIRALAVEPEVLLLDEPLVALDEPGRKGVREILDNYTGTLIVAAPQVTELEVSQTVTLGGTR